MKQSKILKLSIEDKIYYLNKSHLSLLIEFINEFKPKIQFINKLPKNQKIITLKELILFLSGKTHTEYDEVKSKIIIKEITKSSKIKNYLIIKLLNGETISTKETATKFKTSSSVISVIINKIKKEMAATSYPLIKFKNGYYLLINCPEK